MAVRQQQQHTEPKKNECHSHITHDPLITLNHTGPNRFNQSLRQNGKTKKKKKKSANLQLHFFTRDPEIIDRNTMHGNGTERERERDGQTREK